MKIFVKIEFFTYIPHHHQLKLFNLFQRLQYLVSYFCHQSRRSCMLNHPQRLKTFTESFIQSRILIFLNFGGGRNRQERNTKYIGVGKSWKTEMGGDGEMSTWILWLFAMYFSKMTDLTIIRLRHTYFIVFVIYNIIKNDGLLFFSRIYIVNYTRVIIIIIYDHRRFAPEAGTSE